MIGSGATVERSRTSRLAPASLREGRAWSVRTSSRRHGDERKRCTGGRAVRMNRGGVRRAMPLSRINQAPSLARGALAEPYLTAQQPRSPHTQVRHWWIVSTPQCSRSRSRSARRARWTRTATFPFEVSRALAASSMLAPSTSTRRRMSAYDAGSDSSRARVQAHASSELDADTGSGGSAVGISRLFRSRRASSDDVIKIRRTQGRARSASRTSAHRSRARTAAR